MIYIKEEDLYLKYHVSKDGRFICTEKDGSESVILCDISTEFDGVISDSGCVHFVLQGLGGELIYLKKENTTWKKYNIFKSRKGIRRISGIRLVRYEDRLCAFYIMEHKGKNLLVKHIFGAEDLYREPEVLDLTDNRKDFCICQRKNGEIYLFFKNINDERKVYAFDKSFNAINPHFSLPLADTTTLRASFLNDELFFVYTSPRKESNALVFCTEKDPDSDKIITFGLPKNCSPEIIISKEFITVQWEENGTVIQVESSDYGKSFSKPKVLGTGAMIASVRQTNDCDLYCDRCAVYNNIPYTGNKSYRQSQNRSENKVMNTNQYHSKNDIKNDRCFNDILDILKQIETDIETMGKNLEDICSFLDNLKEFKAKTESFDDKAHPDEPKNDIISRGDIGEIDEDNIKLFETTDIDSVLPDNNQ